jgi:hypothetical protein
MNKTNNKKLLRLVLNNWDNLIAMAVCAFASIYGLIGGKVADSWLLASITWALGLIAFSSVKDRSTRENLQKYVEALQKNTATLLKREQYRAFDITTTNAHEICLFGASLVTLLGSHQHHLEMLIKTQGTSVKVIILKNDAPSVESAASCLDCGISELAEEITLSEKIIDGIAKNVKGARGKIELREILYHPNYTLAIVDAEKPDGYITVEYTGYKEKAYNRPHIQLYKNNEADRNWFELYVNDFNSLWNNAIRRISSKS